MNDISNRNPEFLGNSAQGGSSLEAYIKTLSPETIAKLSQPDLDVVRVMEHDIIGMLGSLPNEHFNTTITTSRENLGRLLASAMMSGYFLNNAQQRLKLEKTLQATQQYSDDD
ncbi:MAG: DUF760 domain-containing protein [Okeania sp. SIO2D1]|nr:DUF760 domain-containing protein [Okeania sp. SIO2D1]